MMDKITERDYAGWAADIENDEIPARPTGKGLKGDAARDYALAALEAAAEAPEEIAAVRSAGGRPTLDAAGAPSVSWRLRAPVDLDAKLRAIATAEGRSLSEVLRAAASEYLETRAHAR